MYSPTLSTSTCKHRYSLNGRSMHWEPDTEPGTREWIDFGNLLRQHPSRIMIWENTPLDSVREKLTGMGIHVVVFNPAANVPANGDYFTAMQQNVYGLIALTKQLTE